MKLYFTKKGTEFDTNLPEEMQIWLRDALRLNGIAELTDDVLDVLNIALAKVNASGKQDLFIAYKNNCVNAGKNGEFCSSPFDAAIYSLNESFIVIDSYSEEGVGEYYRDNMPELLDEYIDTMEEDGVEFDEDDMSEFGSWIIDCEVREIFQDADEDKSYDFTDCNFHNSLAQIKEELDKIEIECEEAEETVDMEDFATYKKLVLAGASLLKDLKQIAVAEEVETVFEDAVYSYDAIKQLVEVAADLLVGEDGARDIASIFFADTISVYAYNEEIGEKYYELVLKLLTGNEDAEKELKELSATIPDGEEFWLRRNI